MQRDLLLPASETGTLPVPAGHAPFAGVARGLRFLSRALAREYPAAATEPGAVLAFACPDGDALCADFVMLQADALSAELEGAVLVVDARGARREAGITERLGLAEVPGLSEMMVSGTGEPQVRSTVAPGVFVLSCGRSDLPGTVAFQRGIASLLTWARPRYRYVLLQIGSIVIDTRDLLAALQADGVLLVAREHHTLLAGVEEAAAILRENGAKSVRSVLIEGGR